MMSLMTDGTELHMLMADRRMPHLFINKSNILPFSGFLFD
jgi:hypothetical protein